MGKTAFVLNIAQYAAFHENKAVAIFSLEMSSEQLVNRMFSLESKVDAQKLRTGNLQDNEWEQLVEGASVIAQSKLIIDDTQPMNITEMRAKCRKYQQSSTGLDMIIIDYLQLMNGTGKDVSRQQEISDISRALKGLARELKVPVIALSQLNRGVEQRDDKRPMLSDLRDSGAIEQDADVVMFIYRDDYYNHESEKKGISEIIIAKQRNGPVGTVELVWLPEYTKFANKIKDKKEFKEN
jgi:replicative DNA helicase